MELLLILRHAHGVAAHASIESLPSLVMAVLIVLQFPICSTLLALITTQIWWYLVLPLGIPSFLDCYLNIKPLLHRPAGLSLGIVS